MDTRTLIERLIDEACGVTGGQTSRRPTLSALHNTAGLVIPEIQRTAHCDYIYVRDTNTPREAWVLFSRDAGYEDDIVGYIYWLDERQSLVFQPETTDIVFPSEMLEDIAQFCRAQALKTACRRGTGGRGQVDHRNVPGRGNDMETINGWRIFQGRETTRVISLHSRQPAAPEAWYFEPEGHAEPVLFWLPCASREEAIRKAMDWDMDEDAKP